jgi:hypothetical protein
MFENKKSPWPPLEESIKIVPWSGTAEHRLPYYEPSPAQRRAYEMAAAARKKNIFIDPALDRLRPWKLALGRYRSGVDYTEYLAARMRERWELDGPEPPKKPKVWSSGRDPSQPFEPKK